MITVVIIVTLEFDVTPLLNLTLGRPFRLTSVACMVGWIVLLQTANAQGLKRYPLREVEQTTQNVPQIDTTKSIIRTAKLPIRSLPSLKNVTPESASLQAAETPAFDIQDASSNDFPAPTDDFSGSSPNEQASANGFEPGLNPANPVVPTSVASVPMENTTSSPMTRSHGEIQPFSGGEFEPAGTAKAVAEANSFGEFSGFSASASESNFDQEQPDPTIWWKKKVLEPLQPTGSQQPVDTNKIVYDTLKKSPRILALSKNPLIRELQVIEADSDFDVTKFLRTQFQDRVDPVGDNLSITADGSDFLLDHIWTGTFGIRQKLRTGGTYELGQTLGFKNSNSNFFNPQDQGTATLALNVTQPLMRGRGRYYNQSQILIAQSASGAAWNTFTAELQDEIQKSVESYWRLYFSRSVYLQKQRNVARGEKVLETLEGRRGLDSLPSQITRAKSAVQSRKTDLANALRDIRDSETEIRRLTADRNWQADQNVELLPIQQALTQPLELGLEHVVYTALENRPEIKETLIRSKIAGIKRDISVNELMPELTLLLGTYVSALKGESQLGQAIQDQFGEVTPGYSVGIEFELPCRNRAARSRLAQRQLQLAKIKAEVDETMQNVIAESQISLRRVTSAKETLDAAAQAIDAASADLEQNFKRWESFALIEGDIADGQTPTTILDQLLDSQERLTAAELVYAQSELELNSAEVALQRTMGTLLMHENVAFGKTCHRDLPEVEIYRTDDQNVEYAPAGDDVPAMPPTVESP